MLLRYSQTVPVPVKTQEVKVAPRLRGGTETSFAGDKDEKEDLS